MTYNQPLSAYLSLFQQLSVDELTRRRMGKQY